MNFFGGKLETLIHVSFHIDELVNIMRKNPVLKLIEMDEKHNFISQEKPLETSSNLLLNSLRF